MNPDIWNASARVVWPRTRRRYPALIERPCVYFSTDGELRDGSVLLYDGQVVAVRDGETSAVTHTDPREVFLVGGAA